MVRNFAISTALLFALALGQAALAEGSAQYARFQFGNHSASFQSADKTVTATDDVRSGDVAEMYRTISGKEWTTEKEAKGGVLEFAFLNAFAEQGWEVSQVTYHEGAWVYLLKKLK